MDLYSPDRSILSQVNLTATMLLLRPGNKDFVNPGKSGCFP